MSLYGFALFLHVVLAILLVGGSAAAHLTLALMPQARTVDGVRSHVGWLQALVKGTGPLAGAVLLAGLYLSFAGGWWGTGWPAVSLVLFLFGGAVASLVLDPAVARLRSTIEATPDGPMTAAIGASLVSPAITRVAWLLAGIDLAIVFLMTNKPGWLGSLVTAAAGFALGSLVGQWQLGRLHRRAGTANLTEPPAPEPAG